MHLDLPAIMSGATAQLRAGRLMDATAMIQRALSGGRAAGEVAVPITIEGFAERPGSDTGSFTRHVFPNAAGSRPYMLFVPDHAPAGPMPLIVMLHGCTQNAAGFAAATNMNVLAQAQGCIVAYPEQTAAANASRCWNWFRAGDQGRDAGEPALVAGIVREVAARHAIDRKRIFAAGLSAGGAAAAVLADAYPDLFAAIGVHSGLPCGAARDMPSAMMAMKSGPLATPPAASRAVPTIVFHGDRDRTVNPANGDAVISRAIEGQTCRVTVRQGQVQGGRRYTVTQHADATGRILAEHWVVNGLGHAWSGGVSGETYADPGGPDASCEMLRFFAACGDQKVKPAWSAGRR